MSALGIGLAWAAMAMAAFMALSASAMARTRHDLEGGPGAPAEPEIAVEAVATADAHWPRRSSTLTALRSSPSAAFMTASPARPGPIHLS